jgi:DNA-directed RNA polymerase specialized sigma24 family protein
VRGRCDVLREKPTTQAWVELDPTTIQRALDGDRAAFTVLYRHYRGVVRGAVAARVRAWPSVTSQLEDILGEVWVQMLADDRRALRLYDPTRGELGYFIRLLAASRASTAIRRRMRQAAPLVPVDPDATEEIERAMLQRDFIEALWAKARPLIKDVDEELFVRVMVLGREAKEVALELGLRQDAAYQRIARLRSKLLRVAAELLAEEPGARPLAVERVQAVVTRALVLLVLSSPTVADDSNHDASDGVSPAAPER